MKLLIFYLSLALVILVVHSKKLTTDEKLEQLRSTLAKVNSNDSYLINNLFGLSRQLEGRSKTYNLNNYLGCFRDFILQRMFRGFAKQDLTFLSIDQCINTCKSLGFVYSGVQAGRDCHCGDTAPEPAYNPAVPDVLCNEKCTGNQDQLCGGQLLMSVYRTGIEQYRYNGDRTIGESSTYSEVKWKCMF